MEAIEKVSIGDGEDSGKDKGDGRVMRIEIQKE